MSSSGRIAVVGGGLAGLAAPHALTTFGIKAEVFEAAAALGESSVHGSANWVWGYDPIGEWDKEPSVPAAYAA